jgi:peptidoglycan/LPS O-acetylase OafA/YrhL
MSVDAIKSWEVPASTGKHFDVLDGIRGVAILMVVSFHAFYTNPESGILIRVAGALLGGGWMGVPVFFVLSGFLISYPFFRQRVKDDQFWYLQGYARRRIGKIIPPFYLSLVIFSLYFFIRFSDSSYLWIALRWALGLPNFLTWGPALNSSYWSLVIEVHFYMVLPFLFLLVRGIKPLYVTIGVFAVLLMVPLIVRQLTWPGDAAAKDTVGYFTSRFPCQLDCFAWGVLFAGMFVSWSGFRDQLRSLRWFGYAGLVLLAATVCLYAACTSFFAIDAHPVRWSFEAFHFLPSISTFLLLFFVFDPGCLGVRLLAQPWLRFVGLVSYEWFLFHLPVVWLFRDIVGHSGGNPIWYLLRTVVPLGLTFIVSVLVYRHFSLPLMNWIRNDRSAQKIERELRAAKQVVSKEVGS